MSDLLADIHNPVAVPEDFGGIVQVKNAIDVGIYCENYFVSPEWLLYQCLGRFRLKKMIRHEQQEIIVDCVSGFQSGDAVCFVVVRILDKGHGCTKRPAFKPVADQVRAISHHNHEALDAGPVRTLNDVLDDRLAAKVNQRFGEPAGDRPDSRPVTGSENETPAYFFHRHLQNRSRKTCVFLKSENQLPPESANCTVKKLTKAVAV